MKIVYCLDNIGRGRGGLSIVVLSKANWLAEKGVSVWVVYTENSLPVVSIKPLVKLIDLKIGYSNITWPFPKNLIQILQKRIKHRNAMTSVLKEINPDIVIATDSLSAVVLPRIRGKWCLIREFHSSMDYRRKAAASFWEKIAAFGGEQRDYWLYHKYDKYIVLTQNEKQLYWKREKSVVVIPNPLRFSQGKCSSHDIKRVVSVGRLDSLKNFKSLIRAYKIVTAKHPDWHLDIIGEGPEEANLRKLIEDEGLREVIHMKGFTNNIQEEYLSSSIFAFSSLSESFSLVLIEAMGCGLPVVSYDCTVGAQAIINEGIDGYLVPEGDEDVLAEKINILIEDKEQRKQMGAAAFKKAKDYSPEIIIEQWMGLFEGLIKEKR